MQTYPHVSKEKISPRPSNLAYNANELQGFQTSAFANENTAKICVHFVCAQALTLLPHLQFSREGRGRGILCQQWFLLMHTAQPSLPPTALKGLSTQLHTTLLCPVLTEGPTSQDAQKVRPDASTGQRGLYGFHVL